MCPPLLGLPCVCLCVSSSKVRKDVDGFTFTPSGAGVTSFVTGANVFTVTAPDETGEPLRLLLEDDIDVIFKDLEDEQARVTGVVLTSPGVAQVTYEVSDPAVVAVEFVLKVVNTTIAGSPFRLAKA